MAKALKKSTSGAFEKEKLLERADSAAGWAETRMQNTDTNG